MSTYHEPPPLFRRPEPAGPVRRDHPETSREAARKVGPRIGSLHERLMDVLRAHPEGLTDDAMQRLTGMDPSTQRPRRVELLDRGLIQPAGTGTTAAGRKAIVWRAVA